jgi:hypothetical protein
MAGRAPQLISGVLWPIRAGLPVPGRDADRVPRVDQDDQPDQGGHFQLAVFRRDRTLMTLVAESGAS